jgi:phosphate-selective porin OprO/OprP
MMLPGNFREGLIQYQLALMNGVSSASADVDSTDAGGGAICPPFWDSTEDWPGLGVGCRRLRSPGGTPAGYRAQSQSTFFSYAPGTTLTGSRFRYSPQLYYYWGPFGAMAEYVRTATDVDLLGQEEQFENDAWQVALSYVLTGENKTWKGVVPRQDVGPKTGGWGAWEIAGRYHELRVDDDAFDLGFANRAVSAERARAWGLGLLYMNRW